MKWIALLFSTATVAFGAATGTNYFDNILQTHTGTTTNYFENVVELHSGTSTQIFDNVVSINGSSPLTPPTVGLVYITNSGSATALTIPSFTVSGSNPYLIVFTAGSSSIVARTLSTLTANGVSMLPALFSTNFTARGNVYICGLASPSSGNIVATFSGANNVGMSLCAVLLNGVGSPGGVAGSFSSSGRTSSTATVASVATDLVLDYLAGVVGAPGASQTEVTNVAVAGGNAPSAATSSKQGGGAGSTTMDWTSGSVVQSQAAIALHGM